ncbi:MAG: hypothetical protein SOY17_11710, partial [Evtepia sp.]|nr:hypothetical protein [Evtepia sp.]
DELESIDVSAALTRDSAAQMIWNALQAKEVKYEYTLVSENGQLVSKVTLVDKDKTLLEDEYKATVYEGVLTGSGDYEAGKDKLAMDVMTINGVDYTGKDGKTSYSDDFKYAEDATGLLGQYVKVLVNNKGEAYGVFPVDSENTVVTAAFSDVKLVSKASSTADGKVKVDGTEYKFVNNAKINGITEDFNGLKKTASNSADTITFISNDGDNKFDVAYVNPIQTVAKVTYVSSTGFTAGGTAYDYADVIAPKDLAKDDYVVKTTDLFTGDAKFVKADTVKGKVTSSKGDTGNLTDIAVNGTWYQIAGAAGSAFTNMVGLSTDKSIARDSTYTLQVVNGVVYNAKLESAESTDTALVLGASTAMDTDGNMQVKLLFADGTTKVVPAKADYTSMVLGDSAVNADKAFVSYEVKDGVYKLTTISDDNKLGKDDYDSADDVGFVKAEKKLNGVRVADSAVIYVQYKDGDDYKTTVISGKTLNAMGSNFGDKCYYVVDGSTICAALITADGYMPGASAGKLYGYITSDVTSTNEDGTEYKEFTVWTSKNESVDVKMKADIDVSKKTIISFEMGADNFIEGVSVKNGKSAAIKDFGSDYAIFYITDETKDLSFDDDIQYLYLNTKDVEGVNGGELAKADVKTSGADSTTYYANCRYVAEGGKIVLIAIDTSLNKWDGAKDITVTTTTP